MRQLLDLDRAAARFGGRRVYVAFGATSSAISLVLVAALASLSHQPLLLPSLGSTAFLIFNRPRADAAAPRAIVVGHLAGVLAGETALFLSGLGSKGASLEGLSGQRAFALAIAVVLTTTAMLVLQAPHPPAAATALLVGLGVISSFREVVALLAGVVVLVAQGYLVDRIVGIEYPLWAQRAPGPGG